MMQPRIMTPPITQSSPGTSPAKIITQTGFIKGSIIVIMLALRAVTLPIPFEKRRFAKAIWQIPRAKIQMMLVQSPSAMPFVK